MVESVQREMRRVYAHVRVHGLGAAVEAREHRGPVVLLDESGQEVICVSGAARGSGVAIGQSRWEAERACPGVLVAEPDEAKYAYFWQRVVDICGDYTPDLRIVGGREKGVSLDLTGTERLFGPAKKIGQEIWNRLRAEVGVSASIGIGPNRMVARLAAEAERTARTARAAARSARETERTARVMYVEGTRAARFIAGLPISALPGVDREWEGRLKDMGIRRAGELAALPAEAVERAFGERGRMLWEIARGEDPEARRDTSSAYGRLPITKTEEGLSAQVDVRPATDERARIRAALRAAADELSRKLREHGMVAQKVRLAIVFSDMRKVEARRTLGRATRSGEVLFQAAGILLDRMKLGTRLVRRVRIIADRLSPGPHGGQLGLPLVEQEQRRERLADRVDQVKDRYGDHALRRGSALALGRRVT
ncbi:MAG TPA: hypothetical protein VMY87_07305 [Armatimonadota bacterium]|nr:hypothetical protein [Armatimonadota bacterium]